MKNRLRQSSYRFYKKYNENKKEAVRCFFFCTPRLVIAVWLYQGASAGTDPAKMSYTISISQAHVLMPCFCLLQYITSALLLPVFVIVE